eukprot:332986-Pelagomonas_calceolata.AAC.10
MPHTKATQMCVPNSSRTGKRGQVWRFGCAQTFNDHCGVGSKSRLVSCPPECPSLTAKKLWCCADKRCSPCASALLAIALTLTLVDWDALMLDVALNLAASQRHLDVCQLLLSSCWSQLGLGDLKSDQDKEWLQGALGEQEQANMNSKASEKAMSQAASQAGYSEDEDDEGVIEDDGGESGEDEVRGMWSYGGV